MNSAQRARMRAYVRVEALVVTSSRHVDTYLRTYRTRNVAFSVALVSRSVGPALTRLRMR